MYRPEVDGTFYELSKDELLSILLKGEAGGESLLGKLGVLWVVKNRVKKGGWFYDSLISKHLPDKPYHAVILKNALVKGKVKLRFIYQFSCFQDADPNDPLDDDPNRIKLLTLANNHQFPLLEMVGGLDRMEDPTRGATHYYADYIPKPYWADKMENTCKIGRHYFLR